MNVVFGFCMSSGSSLLFWAENWVKTGPKITPSEFCRLCRSRMSRDRVAHADASFGVLLCHAVASSMRPRHSCYSMPRGRVIHALSFLSRGRVIHAAASLLAGHLLNFLCSFHFCKLPFQSPTHSCPIKPETLNT